MILLLLCFLAGPAEDAPVDFTPEEIRRLMTMVRGPVPPDPTNHVADDNQAIEFGIQLFLEPRFSANGQVACDTCHQPVLALQDGLAVGKGIGELSRNTPSLLNTAYQRWFFWDGRADSLWFQALQPMEEPLESGGNRVAIVRVVAQDPKLKALYEAVFGPLPPVDLGDRFPANAKPVPGQPTDPQNLAWEAMAEPDREAINRAFSNLGKAIAAFERTLVSEQSDFDLFLEGLATKDQAKIAKLNPAAQRGLRLFIGKAGCRNCHSGPMLSDQEFHNTELPPREGNLPKDAGRYEGIPKLLADPFRSNGPYSDEPNGDAAKRLSYLKRSSEQWGQFKTPGLRDVARTAPYMHQGQFATLEEVVHFYNTLEGQVKLGHHQDPLLQPLGLTEEEEADLVVFFKSLDNEK